MSLLIGALIPLFAANPHSRSNNTKPGKELPLVALSMQVQRCFQNSGFLASLGGKRCWFKLPLLFELLFFPITQ